LEIKLGTSEKLMRFSSIRVRSTVQILSSLHRLPCRLVAQQNNSIFEHSCLKKLQIRLFDIFEQGLANAQNDGNDHKVVFVDEVKVCKLLYDGAATEYRDILLLLQFEDFFWSYFVKDPDVFPIRPYPMLSLFTCKSQLIILQKK